jgi:uncharacterized coiled-coil protein SlyX
MSRMIEVREMSIAARAKRIKELEKRMAEHEALIDATLRAIRCLGR